MKKLQLHAVQLDRQVDLTKLTDDAHMTASFSVRELRYLWTWAWLTPYRASMRKIPPTPSVQNVWRSRGSGFRLQRE